MNLKSYIQYGNDTNEECKTSVKSLGYVKVRLSKNCWATYRQPILTQAISAYHFLIG